ncbi:MAG: Lrp/AsnC family transcriptional regulator [Actinomycetota bacterium]|nr:Lrp/AsnC family transcriptional regulator [Actinomycetota bacterium]
MKAYVLIQTKRDTAPISGLLQAIPGVVLADDLRGPYDAIALAHSESSGLPLEGILAEIRNLPGVTEALTAPLTATSMEVRAGEAA